MLFGRNDVPLMWSCGFSESDLRRGAKPTEEDDGGWQPFWFETTTAELTRRFEALSKCLGRSESAYPREVWEGCAILVDALLAVPGDAPAVLDPNEVAQMSEVGVLEASLIQHMRSFAELRGAWDAERACSMTQDVLTGALPSARRRARRITGAPSDRAGFFAMMFGAARGTGAPAIDAWLAAAPRAEPLRPIDEEAGALADALVTGGIITLSPDERARAVRFLETAARFRTPRGLQAVLDALFASRLVTRGSAAPTRRRWLDRIVGPAQCDEVPVFDEALLTSVLATLGD